MSNWDDNVWLRWLILFCCALLGHELLLVWAVAFAIFLAWRIVPWCFDLLGRLGKELCRPWQEAKRRLEEARRHKAWNKEQVRLDANRRTREAEMHRWERARFECEFLYNLFGPELKKRLTRKAFQELLQRWLPEGTKDLDTRAEKLKELIREHAQVVKPIPRFQSFADLSQWYKTCEREIQQIPEEANLDGRMKDTLLALLKETYGEFATKLLSEKLS